MTGATTSIMPYSSDRYRRRQKTHKRNPLLTADNNNCLTC